MNTLNNNYFQSILFCFLTDKNNYLLREQVQKNEPRQDVNVMLDVFKKAEVLSDTQGNYIKRKDFKAIVIEAFSYGDEFWSEALYFGISKGAYKPCCELWWGSFPETAPATAPEHTDYKALYQSYMLKWLVKRLIWDELYPNENLINYSPPSSS